MFTVYKRKGEGEGKRSTKGGGGEVKRVTAGETDTTEKNLETVLIN